MAAPCKQRIFSALMSTSAGRVKASGESMGAWAELMGECAVMLRACANETLARTAPPTADSAVAEMLALADKMSAFADETVDFSQEMSGASAEMHAASLVPMPPDDQICQAIADHSNKILAFAQKAEASFAKIGAFSDKMKALVPMMNAASLSGLVLLINIVSQFLQGQA